MKKLHSNPLYTGDMDKECVPLCNALNAVKGIITTDSCCGHDKNPFIIFFKATSFKGLFFVTRCIDRRYWKHGWKWTCELSVGDMIVDGILPTSFVLSSKEVGNEAYKQANDLVENMNHHLNHVAFKKGFGLTFGDFMCKGDGE